MKTIELLVDQCGFDGLHLGGANQPDGVVFMQKQDADYGVIIDTKAYKSNFNIPASERDKMTRYVNENIQRDERHEPKWWQHFPQEIDLFKFLFVSGRFGGDYQRKLRRISTYTQETPGAAIMSFNLLLLAEKIATQEVDLRTVP
ncbi:MAG: hypothetical protein O7E52_07725 [Candidatus Poribacteria bacterium]|nr:hypothetical protein [Candidatus Poribacteria bacterium]